MIPPFDLLHRLPNIKTQLDTNILQFQPFNLFKEKSCDNLPVVAKYKFIHTNDDMYTCF